MGSLLHTVFATGGATLAMIAAVSIAVLFVTIERLWRLWPLGRAFAAVRRQAESDLVRRQPLLFDADNAMTRVHRAVWQVRTLGLERMRMAGLDAAQREVPLLERGLGLLPVAAQVATLLGLLGTVIGLIESLQTTSQAAQVTPAAIAGGLYKALGCTVAGLWVAIPAYIAYGALAGLSGRLIDQLEHAATDLPTLLAEPTPAAVSAAATKST